MCGDERFKMEKLVSKEFAAVTALPFCAVCLEGLLSGERLLEFNYLALFWGLLQGSFLFCLLKSEVRQPCSFVV